MSARKRQVLLWPKYVDQEIDYIMISLNTTYKDHPFFAVKEDVVLGPIYYQIDSNDFPFVDND